MVAWVGGSGAGESDLYSWTRSHLYDFDGLKKGEEWMVEFFKRAKWAYQNEYDVPDSPPDVYVAVSNSPEAKNLLTWNSADGTMNPDYIGAEAQDVAGYRVYRSEWNPDGPWDRIGEVSAGTHTYTDEFVGRRFQLLVFGKAVCQRPRRLGGPSGHHGHAA